MKVKLSILGMIPIMIHPLPHPDALLSRPTTELRCTSLVHREQARDLLLICTNDMNAATP
jgi:hypothetical protein